MLKTAVSGIVLAALMSSLSIGANLVLPKASSQEPVQTQVQEQIQVPVQTQVQEQIQVPVQEQIQNPVQEQPTAPEGTTDNWNNNGAGCFYTDENGDGICDNYDGSQAGNGYGCRHNFTDGNGDGICDYCTLTSDCGLHGNCPSGYSGQTQPHHNSGHGNGSRRGHHR